jgi:hypothetical protein
MSNPPDSAKPDQNIEVVAMSSPDVSQRLSAEVNFLARQLPAVAAIDAKYGLSTRQEKDQIEQYFHADGRDIVVLRSDIHAKPEAIQAQLESTLQKEMTNIHRQYKVTFAAANETAQHQWVAGADCRFHDGDMIYAKQPTFANLFATNRALNHSRPSQLTVDGKEGVKIYFLDKPIFAKPIYGDKPVLAIYIHQDKDDHIAVLVGPDAEKLPATRVDVTKPQGRNLADVMTHEFTHNSQHNSWLPGVPLDGLFAKIGWKPDGNLSGYSLREIFGKHGETYFNDSATCGQQSAWFEIKDKHLVGENGVPTDKMREAAHFSNDQVRDRALVRPVSYYFPNPIEMLSEGLTTFRSGAESRRQLYHESPTLYDTVAQYDKEELAHFYGVDRKGRNKVLRTPAGHVVARSAGTLKSLAAYESSLSSQ